jgi:hypothetical protein
MATLSRGQTFGSTEQITNTKLHNLVDLGSISGIIGTDIGTSLMPSLPSAAGKINPQNLWELVTLGTNASQPNISIGTHFKVYFSTFASLATFVGARTGQEFTLIAQQASFPSIVDTGSFKLASNWIPAKQYDNIKLCYDGTAFIELGRVVT